MKSARVKGDRFIEIADFVCFRFCFAAVAVVVLLAAGMSECGVFTFTCVQIYTCLCRLLIQIPTLQS